jgi:flavin reductase ActVB
VSSRELDQAVADDVVVAFRDAMGQLAAGVVIVTTLVDSRPWGMTVSACCSISMSPPTLLVSLADSTTSVRAIEASGSFGVSVLGEDRIEAARFASARGGAKFIEDFCVPVAPEESASPAVAGAIAHVDCRVAQTLHVADHILFIGQVESVLLASHPSAPLVYHDRRWHRLGFDSDLGRAPAPDLWW